MISDDELSYLTGIQRHCTMVQMYPDMINHPKALDQLRAIYDDIAKYIDTLLRGDEWLDFYEHLEGRLAKVIGKEEAREWFIRLKKESLKRKKPNVKN